jgi:hypothetical protein
MNPLNRSLLSMVMAALLLSPASFGFQSPLSDESVREAYFLGQRHDESVARFFDGYTRHLPQPKSGPYISSVVFLTPFAQSTQYSSNYVGNYSAQQALRDHRGQEESVKITVEIYLTNSYGPLIADPAGSGSRSSSALIPRPYDFWRDFRVQVYNGDQILSPTDSGGHPLYRCGRYGPCRPMGAAIDLEFSAKAFTSDSAIIKVLPPEGDAVSVDFSLFSLR